MSGPDEFTGDYIDYLGGFWNFTISEFLEEFARFDAEDVRERIDQCVKDMEERFGVKYKDVNFYLGVDGEEIDVYPGCRANRTGFLKVIVEFDVGCVELVLNFNDGEWIDSGFFLEG